MERPSADPPQKSHQGGRTLGKSRKEPAPGGPRRRCVCLCVSPLRHPLSSPPELPGAFSVLPLGGLTLNCQPRWEGRTFPKGTHTCTELPNRQSTRGPPEGSQAVPLPPPLLQVLVLLKDQCLSLLPTRAEKAPWTRWRLRCQLGCVCACPLPCLLHCIRTPFLWGRLGRQGGPE